MSHLAVCNKLGPVEGTDGGVYTMLCRYMCVMVCLCRKVWWSGEKDGGMRDRGGRMQVRAAMVHCGNGRNTMGHVGHVSRAVGGTTRERLATRRCGVLFVYRRQVGGWQRESAEDVTQLQREVGLSSIHIVGIVRIPVAHVAQVVGTKGWDELSRHAGASRAQRGRVACVCKKDGFMRWW